MKKLLFFIAFLNTLSCLAQSNFSAVDKAVTAHQSVLGKDVCVLIYADGKIVHELNKGSYNKTSPELIASCSKWFTAAMVMKFVENGKLSLEDTIGKYLPVFTQNRKGHIKIKHCLNHTTGIQGEEITLANIMARNKYTSLQEEVNDFAKRPLVAEPGTQFFYGNVGLNTAGRIMEIVSGKDFETLFQEYLGKPLGMKQTTFVTKHAVNPSGGATSTADDYMKFMIMLLNNGKYGSTQILKAVSVEQMLQITTDEVKESYVPQQAEGMEYAYGSWVMETDDDDEPMIIGSPGLLGTFPYVDVSRNYAAIIFVKTYVVKGRKEAYSAVKTAIETSLDK